MMMRLLRPLGSQRGVAMPLAMIMLVVMAAMMVAFAVLANTEPTIAGNQQRSAQALALADSGLQMALWALTNSTDPSGKGINLSNLTLGGPAAPTPYDGNTFVTLGGTGGFTVQVTWDASNGQYERTVTAVGWTPTKDGSFLNSHRKVQAIVQMGVVPPLNPPCVVCVAGEVQVNGSAASFDSSQNGCTGSNAPQYAVQTVQALSYNAHPTFTGYGTSGTGAINQTTNPGQFEYSATSLAQFKAYAQAQGTYYQGAVTSLPSGPGPYVVYIDTVDGSTFSNSTPTSNDGSLSLSGSTTFNGTVIVAGTINLAGTTTINGLVYSQNDLSISGHVTVNGALVSENRRDSSSTNIDTDFSGNITMNFNCTNVQNSTNLLLGSNWVVKNGGYLETAGY